MSCGDFNSQNLSSCIDSTFDDISHSSESFQLENVSLSTTSNYFNSSLDVMDLNNSLDKRKTRGKKLIQNANTVLKNSFTTESGLRKHLYIVHNEMKHAWKCKVCSEKFTLLTKFVIHSLSTHDDSVINNDRYSCYICSENPECLANIGLFPCPFCKKTYRSSKALEKHRATHQDHPESAVKKFNILACEFCDEVYRKKADLDWHVRKEHKNEKIVCPMCENATTNLYSHIKTDHLNHKEGGWKCKLCDEIFKHSYSLARHERKRHSGVAQFFCDLCGWGAPDKYYMDKHQLAHDRHVDDEGNYLPLPAGEAVDLSLAGLRFRKRDRFQHTSCNTEELLGGCLTCQCLSKTRLENVKNNSKYTDTFDLEFYLNGNRKSSVRHLI